MMHCLNLNDPTISNIISRIGYLTTSDIITYNGIEILDIVKQQPFLDLKEEIKKSYQYQLNTKEFNQSIDDMVEISFWRIFTPSFYDWFGNWMIQYKLQNNLSLSEKEQDVLATKYQGSYDNLKADISKVVTEDGLPKLVYHGSLYDFVEFKNTDYIHFGTKKSAEDRLDIIVGKLPFTEDKAYSSVLEEQLSNVPLKFGAISRLTIKSYFLNIKNIILSEDVIAGWETEIPLNNSNSGIEYVNTYEDKGSLSYAIKDKNQVKSAILPSKDIGALLVENLVEELKVTPEQAKELIPTKFLNPSDNNVMYFQKLNDSIYGFVTPKGEVFIDKSTQSLNTPFHEFYHIYDKIILSNYDFDDRAKSIIDKLNELVVESGYLDRVKKLDAYKNKSHDEQLAEARATLVGDAASSKINEAEYTFLMKIKKVLKDLVDYILDLIGTKSFKDYSPEQILNMTMEEFTNVMTYDMMYNRSFKDDLELEKIGYDFLKTIDGLNIDEPLIKNIIDAIGTNTLYEIIKYNGIEIFDIVNEKPFLELKKELKTAYQYQLKNKDFDKNIDTLVNISFWRMFTPYFYNWFGDWFIKYKIENNIDLNENEKSIFYNTYNNNYDNLNDNVSKVLTEQGVPKLVYHGSDYNFYEFKKLKHEYQLHHFGTFNSAFERVYRLSSEDLTSEDKINSIVDKRDKYVNQYMVDSYDALAKVTIKPYFLSIKKLFKSTDKGVNRYKDHLPEDVDGYQYKNTVEDIGSVSYATRKPDKIKSAIVASNDIYDILYNYLYKRKGLKLEESKKIMFSKFINLETNKNIYFQSLDLNNNQNNEISDDREKQIEELFDNNPKIANQVYEALGFISDNISVEWKSQDEYDNYVITKNNKYIGEIQVDSDGQIWQIVIESDFQRQGYATQAYLKLLNLNPNVYQKQSNSNEKSWKAYQKALQQKQQALQLYSEFLESLNKPNTNPILQDNQQEQVKKFAELQERLSNKEFLEGAKLAFESSEELQKFGTQEEYNDYIARVSLGIIKNPSSGEYNYYSQVRDILYHGTDTKKDKFSNIGAGTHFGTKQAATERRNKIVLSNILNINNPVLFKDILDDDVLKAADRFLKENGEYLEYGYRNEESGLLVYLYNQGKIDSDTLWDALYSNRNTMMHILQEALNSNGYKYINEVEDKGSTSYVVFDPEQIHILSSKADIQGFKEFVSKNQNVQLQTDNNLIPTQQSETYDYVFEKLFENFKPYVTELTTDRKRAQEILNGYDTVQYQDKKIGKGELKIDMAEKINDINRNKEIENQIKQFNNDDANSYWSLSTNEEEIKRILKFKYPLLDFVIINEYLDLDNFDNSQVLKAKIKVEPYKNIFYGQTHANLHLDIFQIEDVESEHIVKSLDSLLNKTDDTMPIYINDRIYYRINDSIFKSGPIRLQYNNFDIISDSEFDRLKEITDIAFEEISSDDFLYLDDMLYYMENNIADDLNQQTRGKIALLKDIKEKSPVEYYSILAKYLINSLPLLYDESFSFGNYSQSNTYNPQNDALSYSIEYRNYIPVLLHELMHNFQTPDTAYTHKEEEFINKITELYKMAVGQVLDNYFDLPFDYYRNYSEVVGKDGKSYYGLVNINEFIAESMTNPEFQRYLSTIKTNNGKSVFEEIYDAVVKLIKSLLNEDISTESNLLIDTIDTIVDFMEKHNIHENVGKELMWDRWKVDIINKDPSMTYDIWQSLTNKEKLQIINCL